MNNKQSGRRTITAFALIEAIVAITLSGVFVALLLPLLSSALTENARQVQRLPGTYALRAQMDRWAHLHRTDPAFQNNLPNLLSAIQKDARERAEYELVSSSWTSFDPSGQQQVGTIDDLLSITLGNGQGNRLTFIFSPLDLAPAP